jgi:hypothetical protein
MVVVVSQVKPILTKNLLIKRIVGKIKRIVIKIKKNPSSSKLDFKVKFYITVADLIIILRTISANLITTRQSGRDTRRGIIGTNWVNGTINERVTLNQTMYYVLEHLEEQVTATNGRVIPLGLLLNSEW